jgi:hypothetical protein
MEMPPGGRRGSYLGLPVCDGLRVLEEPVLLPVWLPVWLPVCEAVLEPVGLEGDADADADPEPEGFAEPVGSAVEAEAFAVGCAELLESMRY